MNLIGVLKSCHIVIAIARKKYVENKNFPSEKYKFIKR